MKMEESDRYFIEKLYNEKSGENICNIFDSFSKSYKECRLIYFNLGTNPLMESFKYTSINRYSIIGVSDYEKSYILDSRYNSKSDRELKLAKIINLDLNVLTYLYKIFENNNLEDKNRFIDYLNYIKENKYNLNMGTSLAERIGKPINLKIWSKIILSYVKYDSLGILNEHTLKENNALPESKYQWAKDILDSSNYSEYLSEQFSAVSCLLGKSLLLKMEKSDLKTKYLKLLEYSLYELDIYLEFELYLMYKYLSNDEDIQRTFGKIQNISVKIIDNIKNTSWDILHIRLVEQQMINDLRKDSIVFHYIGTKDKGLQKIININPLKMVGYLDNQPVIVRENNINDIISNDQINDMLDKYRKNNRTLNVNHKEKFSEICKEIEKLV